MAVRRADREPRNKLNFYAKTFRICPSECNYSTAKKKSKYEAFTK